MKRTLLILSSVVFLVLVISVVSAVGVSYPHPQNIELRPGESSYFTFQIQADNFPLVCIPEIENAAGLEFAFNQQYEIEANQRYNVKPQLIVPKQTGLGNYKATFCVECAPSEDVSGSKIIPKVCNLPVTANVVSERTRPNMFEEEGLGVFVWITLLVAAIIILAIIILVLVKRRR